MKTTHESIRCARGWVIAALLFGPVTACEDPAPGTGERGDACATDDDCRPDLECDVHDDTDAGTCKSDHDDG